MTKMGTGQWRGLYSLFSRDVFGFLNKRYVVKIAYIVLF